MKRNGKLVVALLMVSSFALACGDEKSHEHEGHDHDHAGHSHGDAHHGHTHEGKRHELKAQKIGAHQVSVTQIGEAEPQHEVVIEIELEGPDSVILRYGLQSAEGKELGRSRMAEKTSAGDYDLHVMLPKEFRAGDALWVELEVNGEAKRGVFELEADHHE